MAWLLLCIDLGLEWTSEESKCLPKVDKLFIKFKRPHSKPIERKIPLIRSVIFDLPISFFDHLACLVLKMVTNKFEICCNTTVIQYENHPTIYALILALSIYWICFSVEIVFVKMGISEWNMVSYVNQDWKKTVLEVPV